MQISWKQSSNRYQNEAYTPQAASSFIQQWMSNNNIPEVDHEKFQAMIELELMNLHSGNCARYQLRLSEFTTWYELWHQNSE